MRNPHCEERLSPDLYHRYTAHLRLQQDGALIKIDQEDLETVVPQVTFCLLCVYLLVYLHTLHVSHSYLANLP